MNELQNYPYVLSVKDIQTILGIGTSKAYDLSKSNVFQTIRIGPLIKIPNQSFLQWLNDLNNYPSASQNTSMLIVGALHNYNERTQLQPSKAVDCVLFRMLYYYILSASVELILMTQGATNAANDF